MFQKCDGIIESSSNDTLVDGSQKSSAGKKLGRHGNCIWNFSAHLDTCDQCVMQATQFSRGIVCGDQIVLLILKAPTLQLHSNQSGWEDWLSAGKEKAYRCPISEMPKLKSSVILKSLNSRHSLSTPWLGVLSEWSTLRSTVQWTLCRFRVTYSERNLFLLKCLCTEIKKISSVLVMWSLPSCSVHTQSFSVIPWRQMSLDVGWALPQS